MQHMKLCSFLILVAFKFGIMDPIHQNFSVYGKITLYTVQLDPVEKSATFKISSRQIS